MRGVWVVFRGLELSQNFLEFAVGHFEELGWNIEKWLLRNVVRDSRIGGRDLSLRMIVAAN